MDKTIYLDNAATTFPKPECVYTFMDEFYRNYGVNAGRSGYKLSKKASEIIQETRTELSNLVGVNDQRKIIFTPSATIAINQVLYGLDWSKIRNVYISEFEHNAIARTLHHLSKKFNFKIHFLKFSPDTFEINTKDLAPKLINDKPDLVCISHISNVTGYILPIEQIIEMVSVSSPIILLDCAQSIGLVDIDLSKLDIDFAVFAGHKTLYGPFGVAGIVNNSKKVKLSEFIVGGTGSDSTNLDMPSDGTLRYEAGSYNIQAIAGLNAAIKWIEETKTNVIYRKEKELTDYLVNKLEEIEEIQLYLPKDRDRHIGIVSFNIDGYSSQEVASILDRDFNISVRAGHHCAPYVGRFLNTNEGVVRVSLSYFNDKEDVDILIEALNEILWR
ncbi:aminotransferase class V-fold PLP-dependent enzyme [Clostridium sp. YIM B02515]|uniref:cysteine desulfurase n=1 Tax=Clostridium rhizosphaerae TaxID=2803861 RepID=A0ABS1T9Z0_9CLOT|nr:aminotransferase class V-fold PLP-dependent enzyme [Clostridium rhizosphaerae]MBL4935572.1 aminotransferase class V-fold PLP-dependent enzyme [Clostridium rhizosphaerae]